MLRNKLKLERDWLVRSHRRLRVSAAWYREKILTLNQFLSRFVSISFFWNLNSCPLTEKIINFQHSNSPLREQTSPTEFSKTSNSPMNNGNSIQQVSNSITNNGYINTSPLGKPPSIARNHRNLIMNGEFFFIFFIFSTVIFHNAHLCFDLKFSIRQI